jgi:hypothetical protein
MAEMTLQAAIDQIKEDLAAQVQLRGPFADTAEVPTPYDQSDIYLIGSAAPSALSTGALGGPGGDQPILVRIGSTEVDLSGYYDKEEVDDLLDEKVNVATAADEIMVDY